jgi:hypothetical protein
MRTITFNLRIVVAIAICLSGLTAFSGCEEKDNPIKDNPIIGKWVVTDSYSRHNDTIHFTSDMRIEDYFMFMRPAMHPESSYYFTYSLKEKTIEITSHQPENAEFSETFEYVLDGNSLTIKGFSNPFSMTLEVRTDVHFKRVK